MKLRIFSKIRKPFLEEEKLQIECVRWFERTHPAIKNLLHHSPNEGQRSWFERMKLTKMGMRAGFPDLILLKDNSYSKFLAIELKTLKGNQSKRQKDMQITLMKEGGKYVICRTLEDFKQTINNYLVCYEKNV